MPIVHVVARTGGGRKLFLSDEDRFGLLSRWTNLFGQRVIGFCLMANHIHFIIESTPEVARKNSGRILAAYIRSYNYRNGFRGPLLEGPVEALRISTTRALAQVFRYVHQNPVETKTPIVENPVEYEWSSCRDLAGLRVANWVNVTRARDLLGHSFGWVMGWVPRITEPVSLGSGRHSCGKLMAAAAATHGVHWKRLIGKERAHPLRTARRTYFHLGRMEGHSIAELGRALGRGRSQSSEIASGPENFQAVRIAWTILQNPDLAKSFIKSIPALTRTSRPV